jgi:glycosyltransferase involved in cell wall biosynthesis
MSDKPEDLEYEERTSEEMAALSNQFTGSLRAGLGPRSYVAKAAPGFDTHGVWHCFGTGSRSGYATHAVATHWLMTQVLNVPAQLVPHRNQDIDIERFPDDRYEMLFEWHKSAVGVPHMLLCSYPPEVAAELDGMGPPLVPYCAFEGTKVGAYMRDLCNGGAFHSVWVVSPFVQDAMVAGGVDPARVRCVRPPVCDGPWEMVPDEELRRSKSRPVTPDDPFVFGCLGTWQKRKGFHDLIRAYFGAFRREDSVKLVLRTSSFGENLTIRQFKQRITEEVAEIAKEFGDDDFPASKKQPKLQLLLGTSATDQEVVEWLSTLDCYANATYGEGLGIPHIWAKAGGVPMVSTGYGAVGEMLDGLSPADTLIEHQLQNVDDEICRYALMFDHDSQWGVYDPAALGDAMRLQYEQGRRYDEVGSALVREMFSAEVCAPGLRQAMQEVVESEWAEKWQL